VASVEPLPEPGAIIGSLTAGGDATPEKKQRAGDLIADLEKRLAALSNDIAKKQRDGITRVRNFEREARKALDSGDAEGAVTLATKAKLLLDDIVK
jgi:predicted acylesterase/phospholipase RssA